MATCDLCGNDYDAAFTIDVPGRGSGTFDSFECAIHAGAGTTSLVVSPGRGLRAIDGLLTGWHEPTSSHLLLLEAAMGRDLLARSYAAASAEGYRRHEFGDVQLVLP